MNDMSTERAGRSVSLTWYGQSGFRLAAGDSRVLIDPFLTDRDDRNYYRPPASAAAVPAARLRSEETIRSGRSAASSRAARSAWAWPVPSSGMSLCPWNRRSAFHTVWPCRHNTSLIGRSGSLSVSSRD